MSLHTWYTRIPARLEPLLLDLEQQDSSTKVSSQKKKTYMHPCLTKNTLLMEKKQFRFPTLSEIQLVRHYYRLANLNYSWEDGLYPLGSCTMKYNPIQQEVLANDVRILSTHPFTPEKNSQGLLQLIYETQETIRTALDIFALTLQPAAGAHGEITGIQMATSYFQSLNEKRTNICIPDSAHGTNPASATMGGYKTIKIPSYDNGLMNIEHFLDQLSTDTAMLMLTNPNTLGIFERDILKIKAALDQVGVLLYIDGANLNAFLGKLSLEKMGVDLVQLNLHKTFSTPHGGGGPGQGALGCSQRMSSFLPSPLITYIDNKYTWISPKKTIGPIKGFYGQFSLIVRAWGYLKRYGFQLNEISERAVLNANYLRKKIEPLLSIETPTESTLHEVVFNEKKLKEIYGITTIQFAKALLDRGFYAPTIHFPLNVQGAIMIEPTETETKEELDLFVNAIKEILDVATSNPEHIQDSPHNTAVRQIDEVLAAREPTLRW